MTRQVPFSGRKRRLEMAKEDGVCYRGKGIDYLGKGQQGELGCYGGRFVLRRVPFRGGGSV